MSADRLPSVALTALLVAAAVVVAPRSADAQLVQGYFFSGGGFRVSGTLQKAGLAVNVGGGMFAGPFGLEIEAGWTADTTFKDPDERVAARSTNWLNFQFGLPLTEALRLVAFAGPGLGWIKPGGQIGGRTPSSGIHEGLRVDIMSLRNKGTIGGFSFRFEANHLWQPDVVQAPDHGFSMHVMFLIGTAGDL